MSESLGDEAKPRRKSNRINRSITGKGPTQSGQILGITDDDFEKKDHSEMLAKPKKKVKKVRYLR